MSEQRKIPHCIIVELESEWDAEYYIDEVRQLFMRRNPLDEPFIHIKSKEGMECDE